MRYLYTILLSFIAFPLFGQDSLILDTLRGSDSPFINQSTITDSQNRVESPVPKPTTRKKAKKSPVLTDTATNSGFIDPGNIKNPEEGFNYLALFLGIGLAALLVYVFYQFLEARDSRSDPAAPDDSVKDYFLRLTMTRRDYYRNVYLKSAAWKRKRHVVLKRDNWTCIYCGAKATQVHHTRYAKYQIGKEPIEWLVSICSSCHEEIH